MPPYWTEIPLLGSNPLSLLHLLFLGTAIFFSYKKLKTNTLGKYFLAGLFFKLAAGIGVSLVYYYYYRHGDIIQSFKVAGVLRDIFWENPENYLKIVFLDQKELIIPFVKHHDITPRAMFFHKLVSPFSILSAHNFWIILLYWSFLGYLAMWSCADRLAQTFGNEKAWAAAFLFCPSVAVWTSGLFKENVFWIAFSVLIIILFIKKVTFFGKMLLFLIVFICFALIFYLKYYYFAVIAPIWFSLYFTIFFENFRLFSSFDQQKNNNLRGKISRLLQKIKYVLKINYYKLKPFRAEIFVEKRKLRPTKKSVGLKYLAKMTRLRRFRNNTHFFSTKISRLKAFKSHLVFLTLFFLLIFLASFLHPNLHLNIFLESLEKNYLIIVQSTKNDNLIEFERPFTWFSLFWQSPKALITSFLRPFFWEEGNFLKHLVGIENAVLVGIFLYGFWKKRPNFPKTPANPNLSIFLLALILYVFILAILLPFSAPNIGSLLRYKVSFMPFLVYFLTFHFFCTKS